MKLEKKRLSLFVPAIVYDRLDTESKVYGISKTAIVQNALLAYYRDIDSKHNNREQSSRMSSGLWNTAGRRKAVEDMPQKPLDIHKNAIMQATRTWGTQFPLSPR